MFMEFEQKSKVYKTEREKTFILLLETMKKW